MTYKKHLSRILTFCFRLTVLTLAGTFLFSVMFDSAAHAVAPTPAELKALRDPTVWYDPTKVECSAPPETASSSNAQVLEGSDNVKQAFLYFIQRGLTAQQSAGIVGNLFAESGVKPDTQELRPLAGRGGYGIAQWTGSRRVAIENYAASTGGDLKSLKFQLDYLYDQELMKGYRNSVLEPIKRTTTVLEASNVFLFKFEAPANQSTSVQNKRASYGEKILSLYGAAAGSVAVVPAGQAQTAANTCAAAQITGNSTFVGFPLDTTKARVAQQNSGCFSDTAQRMCEAGHPYVAFDIMADEGTKVLSISAGKVISVTTDRCGGRLISIYDQSQDVTISYMHMSIAQTKVKVGDTITPGQQIDVVGSNATEACSTGSHLHIDAVVGQPRPGCSRLACPAANAAQFAAGDQKIGLGAGLYNGYKKLP